MTTKIATLPSGTRKRAAARVRRARNLLGCSREQLVCIARAAGLEISDRTIGAIERGEVPSRTLRLVTERPRFSLESRAADLTPVSPRFAERPTPIAAAPESSMHDYESLRSGRMTIVVLVLGLCAGALAMLAVSKWVAPEPSSVPCGRTIKLGSGYEAYVECADDDAQRSGD